MTSGWTPSPSVLRTVRDQTDLVFLFVTSRSGSTLIQTLLDGHPQVLQHPNFFKFFDFLAATPNLPHMGAVEAARAFAEFPGHERLFDTDKCHVYGGRIGLDMSERVVIDKTAFVEACAAALPQGTPSTLDLIYAIQLAFAWLLGNPIENVRICLQHIHHGDWLWPDLVETYNLNPPPQAAGVDLLRPDKIVISMRNPVETLASLQNLVAGGDASDDDKERHFGVYYRLYAQDVLRQQVCLESGIPTRVIDLKDMRMRTEETMRELAIFLGIDPGLGDLTTPTAFRKPWFGDRASRVSNKPQAQAPIRPLQPGKRDEAALILSIGDLIEPQVKGLRRTIRRLRARWGMKYGQASARPWNPSEACRREVEDKNVAFVDAITSHRAKAR